MLCRLSYVGPEGDIANGADDGTRTRNRRFTKPLLYQLSYVGAAPKHPGVSRAPANDRPGATEGSSDAVDSDAAVRVEGVRVEGVRATGQEVRLGMLGRSLARRLGRC